MIADEAKGIQIRDMDGRRFVDLTSSIHTMSLGYQHPRVVEAIKTQTERMASFSLGLGEHQIHLDLAEKVHSILPSSMGRCQVAYCSSGSEAIESAMRLVREATSKPNFVSYLGACHGFTAGALSITTSNATLRRNLSQASSSSFYAPYPYCYRCPYGLKYPDCGIYCADKLAEIFETATPLEDTGALFAEPIQVHGGIIVPPERVFSKGQTPPNKTRGSVCGR